MISLKPREMIKNLRWSDVKTWSVVHLLFFYIFFTSGLIITFCMLLTYLLVWRLSETLYRKIIVHLAYSLWSQLAFFAQWWSGSDVTLHFENEDDCSSIGQENTLVLMNHKYDIDWLMTWIITERIGILSTTKVFVKNSLKYVPIFGWAWVFTESIFLKRSWEKDRKIISRDLQFLHEYPPGYNITLLMFCEGTRFSEKKLIESNKFAAKNNLTQLKHTLVPRTKGFVLTMEGIKEKFDAVWDITIGFRKDGAEPTVQSIFDGKPTKAELYCRRIPIKNIPVDDDTETSDWLYKTFAEKDEIYDHFSKNGCFKIGHKKTYKKRPHDLINFLCWFILLTIPLIRFIWYIAFYGSLLSKFFVTVIFLGGYLALYFMKKVSTTKKRTEYEDFVVSSNKKKKD